MSDETKRKGSVSTVVLHGVKLKSSVPTCVGSNQAKNLAFDPPVSDGIKSPGAVRTAFKIGITGIYSNSECLFVPGMRTDGMLL